MFGFVSHRVSVCISGLSGGAGFLGTIGARRMTFSKGLAKPRVRLRYFWLAIALVAVGPLSSQAKADEFGGPSFRKGMWHFVRTLDLVHQKSRQRLLEREMTRCVD